MNEMMEDYTPSQEGRQYTGASVADLITVGKNGNTFHRSGNGQMLSNHELSVIDAHSEMIREGARVRHGLGAVASKELVTSVADLYQIDGSVLQDEPTTDAETNDVRVEDHGVDKNGYRVLVVDGVTLFVPPKSEEIDESIDEDAAEDIEQPTSQETDQAAQPTERPQEQRPRSRWGGKLRNMMVGLLAVFSLR